MRRIFISIATLAAVLGLRAEGYQVNTLSTRQTGMGHVGVAMKLGAESQLFNPGALAFSDKTFDISASVAAISAYATATYHGVDYKTDNDLSTPFNISSSWRIIDGFYGGVTFYTPYGSSINWGEHWPGAVLNQKVGIKMFTVQPTLSYRFLPNLSVGAGLMLSWGSVDLYKGLLGGESLNRLMGALGMPPEAMYAPGATPASVNLKGSSKLAVGYSLGAMWDISRRWTVGVSYRSKMTMTVEKGDAAVSYSGAAESMLSPVLFRSCSIISTIPTSRLRSLLPMCLLQVCRTSRSTILFLRSTFSSTAGVHINTLILSLPIWRPSTSIWRRTIITRSPITLVRSGV